ncbi:MAG: glycosyltransferase [Clostridia bacterium]|nr:glycosyltransferase [Clostridia bacterium]MBQ2251698.1 glycosyltransferase [Clostridia bacterium]
MLDIITVVFNAIITFLSRFTKIVSYVCKYRDLYKVTGLFCTRKFEKTENYHKYACLISARNEESVIGNLIDSIRANDYPQELVTIFVVADNCTDNTAKIAREKGAICYERFDDQHKTKGFALQFLINNIKNDFGSVDAFDGYFIFDADNLLEIDYISRMNESFDAGERVITSYRASKNFSDNWISASYALHWLRTIRNENRARSIFRLATRIQGTGYLVGSEVIPDGWNFTTLTEDRELSAAAVIRGYRISYNHDAIFYDEQPVDLKIALRQRLRWAKGHIQALVKLGGKLFLNIFKFDKMSFISFDMLTVVWPRSLETIFRKVVTFVLKMLIFVMTGAALGSYLGLVYDTIYWVAYSYGTNILMAIYLFIIEHSRIPKMSIYKKAWFCLTFPIFDIIGKWVILIALFMKVEWKPIPHTIATKIEELSMKK